MLAFLALTAVSFSLFGFIIGMGGRLREAADHSAAIITPLTFLGGSFYSLSRLPLFWQTVTMFNPLAY